MNKFNTHKDFYNWTEDVLTADKIGSFLPIKITKEEYISLKEVIDVDIRVNTNVIGLSKIFLRMRGINVYFYV